MLPAAPAALADPVGPKIISGWVERVVILPAGHDVKAKLDTGALTSSINATDIERFERNDDSWVRFTLRYTTTQDEEREQTLERPLSRKVRIKEHEGEYDRRVVVELPLCFNGERVEAEFTLVDRSRFIYPVLLGRRFLRERAIIDPDQTFLTRNGCGDEPTEDGA